MQFQATFQFLNQLLHGVGLVRWMPIDDQKYFLSTPLHEIPKELQEPSPMEHFGLDRAPEAYLCTHRANGADHLSLAGRGDAGGLSLESVGAA